jgi:hypothetical protein
LVKQGVAPDGHRGFSRCQNSAAKGTERQVFLERNGPPIWQLHRPIVDSRKQQYTRVPCAVGQWLASPKLRPRTETTIGTERLHPGNATLASDADSVALLRLVNFDQTRSPDMALAMYLTSLDTIRPCSNTSSFSCIKI